MKITIQSAQDGKRLGDLFGLFFEDINHAADGGLYAELIRNRDFEFDAIDRGDYHALTAWSEIGYPHVRVLTEEPPFPRNPHYVFVACAKDCGLSNLGYGSGIPAEKGKQYNLTVWARSKRNTPITVSLCGASVTLTLNEAWTRHTAVLTPEQTDLTSRLLVTAAAQGEFELAYVSLFPEDTFMHRPNGLRKDIAQALCDMKPRFLRFPGGCLTHDGDLDPNARNGIYNWKLTVGEVENRPGRRNNWGYHQTMGLGFFEYFQFCEDIGCEPLPVLNGGIDPHHLRFATGEVLDAYIQDALDLIDFAKGSTDTYWGNVRAQMGHPEPFPLHYLAIGNEEIHLEFHENMTHFAKALREKDPTVALIGSSGPFAAGWSYDLGWEKAREQQLDYVDEHYYSLPEWLIANIDRYDHLPVDGPKVFLGEYASWGNRMHNALCEAAYMTALQNAPAVGLACYAPMLCHVNYINWQPDMLWFDNTRLFKTPNYHVQSLFMRHQGSMSLPCTATDNDPIVPSAAALHGRIFFEGDETDIQLTDIVIQDGRGVRPVADCQLANRDLLPIGETDGDFTLTFTMKRTNGRKGMRVFFNDLDILDRNSWVIGGWQNSDSALERLGRGSSCLTQTNFSVETDHAYRMELRVQGRTITTLIDGKVINQAVDSLPSPKPLYLCASEDESTGDIILKAVNIRDTDVCAELTLPAGFDGHCIRETLCADPESENSLETPDNVAPVTQEETLDLTAAQTFPAHSVTVLRFVK